MDGGCPSRRRPARAKSLSSGGLMMLPLQGAVFIVVPIPRVLPWARWYCPFGANHTAHQRPYPPRKGPYTRQSSITRRASALTRPARGLTRGKAALHGAQAPLHAPQGALHAAKPPYTARKRLYPPRRGPFVRHPRYNCQKIRNYFVLRAVFITFAG